MKKVMMIGLVLFMALTLSIPAINAQQQDQAKQQQQQGWICPRTGQPANCPRMGQGPGAGQGRGWRNCQMMQGQAQPTSAKPADTTAPAAKQ